jgi:hypothetical protein
VWIKSTSTLLTAVVVIGMLGEVVATKFCTWFFAPIAVPAVWPTLVNHMAPIWTATGEFMVTATLCAVPLVSNDGPSTS